MKYLVLIVSLMLAWQVEASVLINEIMYDPIGPDANREWIELVNTGTDPVDITGWKLFEANSNHGLTVSRGTFVIPQNGYIIIADNGPQFIADNPSYLGSVLDSTFSLNNTGETFEIRNNALVMQDSLNYVSSIGASENSASLTRTSSGGWIEAIATPGITNSNNPYTSGGSGGQNTGSGNSGNNGSGSGGSSGGAINNSAIGFAQGIKKEKLKDFEPYYSLSVQKDKEVITVGTPVTLDILAEYIAPRETKQIISGITYVSFGDGTKTLLPKITPLVHEWSKSGIYTIVVTYKTSQLFAKPLATVKEVVEVVDPTLTLSVNDSSDIVITNFGDETLDISKWYITQGVEDTQLPEQTYVQENSKLVLSGQFSTYLGGSLELLTPSGVSVVSYISDSFVSENNSGLPSGLDVKSNNQSMVNSMNFTTSIEGDNKKSSPFDWLALLTTFLLVISYCVVRFVVLGSVVSFSFVDISESVEILDDINEGTFFS